MSGNISRKRQNTDLGDISPRLFLSPRMCSRRGSIALAGAEFQNELQEKLTELRTIWNEVGMSEEQRRDRMDTAFTHLKSLLTEMVDEEHTMRDTLFNSFTSSKVEIEILLQQLHQPKPDFLQEKPGQTWTLLDLEEKCRSLKNELSKEKDERLRERDILMADDIVYTTRLGTTPFLMDTIVIPSRTELQQLKNHVEEAKHEWDRKLSTFTESRLRIQKLSRKVQFDHKNLSRFQRFLMSNDIDTNLTLPPEHMIEMAALENMLKELYNAYLEEIRQRIDVVQSELIKWWEQCHVPPAERERFQTVDPELDPETAVNQYNEAIDYWRAFYESRRTVLDKIGEWEGFWNEHVQFEERERDYNRYNNRGGALLLEEKKRKKVQAMLPKVKAELADMVAKYNEEHRKEPFLMDGVPVMEYIDMVEFNYHEKKKKEKEEKEQQKKQQLTMERLYGAMPNTPASQRKRLVSANAGTTPTSPSKKHLGVNSQSKAYIHSSLAGLRSPGAKLTTSRLDMGSSAKKVPAGLPPRGGQQSIKRKALMQQQDTPAVEHNQVGDGAAAVDGHHTTVSSTGSYGDFAKVLRTRGLDVQSSFIGAIHPQPQHSPQKMPRLN